MPLDAVQRPTPAEPPQLLRPAEVAAVLGVTPRTVRKLAAAGELRKVRLSERAVRYVAADVAAYIASRTDPTKSNAEADDLGAATSVQALGDAPQE